MRWAGVDVGGRKGFDVAVIAQEPGGLVLVDAPRRENSVAGVTSVLHAARPAVVAVDSPISAAADGAKSREGERALARAICGIRYTPDIRTLQENKDDYYGWILNGLRLYAALDGTRRRWTVIECFPTASWTRLGGPRNGRRRSRWTSEILHDQFVATGLLSGIPQKLNQDERDAIVAAYTAYLFDHGATEQFGDLVVPTPAGPELKRGVGTTEGSYRLEPGWWVRLDGEAFDLNALRDHMRRPDVLVVQREEAHYLRAADFEGFGADHAEEVHRRAVELVDVLNAAAALVDADYRPVTVGGTVRAAEDGSLHTTVFASGALVIVSGMRARLTIEGRDEDATEPSTMERIAWRAMEDGKARQALRIFARQDVDYRDLYFVLELIQEARQGAIYGDGWATPREVERFKHTANSPSVLGEAARHASEQTEPPRNPMPFEEAQALIRRLLTAWLS